MESFSRFITPGVIFLATVVTGLWLSHSGRPLSSLLTNAHKLIALAAAVTAGVQFARLFKISTSAVAVVLLVIAGVCAISLFASGAFLSMEKPAPALVLRIHQIAPLLLLVSSAASIWLWMGQST